MKPAEILRIISACKQAGVREIKTPDLHLSFFTGEAEKPKIDPEPIIPIFAEMEAASVVAERQSNNAAIDDSLETMLIDDPSAFEEHLGEIEFSEENESKEVVND